MSNRRLDFVTGDRMLFVGTPSSIPYYDDSIAIRDESRLRRVLGTHLDTEQEAQRVMNLAESYNQACMPARSIRDAREAIIDLARRGRLVVVEVESLGNEPELDAVRAQNVSNMDMTDKAGRVLDLLPNHMGREAAEELRALVDPTTIAIALGLMVLAFTSGVGAAILIAVGWAFLGWSVFEAVSSMWKFVNRFSTANTDSDLDACAKLLADAIAKISVGLFVKLITRGASRAARARGKLSKNSGGGSGTSRGSQGRKPPPKQQRRPEPEKAPAPKKPKKPKSKREQYVGRTPGKKSKTGQEVIARMRAERPPRVIGRGDRTKFLASNGKWYPLKDADMAHKTDAVTWWNTEGRKYGAKSKKVREWMLNSNNYELDHFSLNRSAGAKLGKTQQYLPPLK